MAKPVRKLAGFTLIELLIVIAVIGILAVAVLSAINPIEQIKKGRDTAKKADAAELLNAVERYYATFETTPWLPPASKPSQAPMASNNAGILELIAKSELKDQFKDRTYLSSLIVTEAATDLVTVCFVPESATFRAKAKKSITGADTTAACATWSSSCYVCLPE